jgi:HNH endonuclease
VVELAAATHAAGLHLPWWIWPPVAIALLVAGLEEKQRSTRKAKHRRYLKSAAWKGKRRQAIARAGGRCQDCGSTEHLHVHHLTYARHGHEESGELRVLCSRCHRRRHRGGGRADDLADLLVNTLKRD